jgi:hypothetical protein
MSQKPKYEYVVKPSSGDSRLYTYFTSKREAAKEAKQLATHYYRNSFAVIRIKLTEEKLSVFKRLKNGEVSQTHYNPY